MTARFSGGLFNGREAEIEDAEPIFTVEGIPGPMDYIIPEQVMTSQRYELQGIWEGIALYMAIE